MRGALPLIASGKVRNLYDVDDETLLFVVSDRISAYDVIMKNVSVTHYTAAQPKIIANIPRVSRTRALFST